MVSLSRSDFGGFALAYATYVFALEAMRALCNEPMAVRFSGVSSSTWRSGISGSTGAAMVVGLVFGVACAFVGLASGGTLREALLMLGLAMPLLLVQDCWRAGFFAAGRGDLAFANDAVWALVQFPLMVVVLTSTASRSVAVFVLVWSAGGTAAALFGALQARSVPRPDRVTGWFGRHRDLAPRFFGEFVAVNATLTGTTYLTAAFGGMTAAATLRAAQVALSPLHIIGIGLTSVAVPHAVRLRHTSPRKLWPFARRLGAVMAGSCVVWGALVVLVPTDTGRHLLGPSWPSARAVLVPLTVAMAAGGACAAAIVGLRGIAAASRSLRARVWGGVTTLSFAALGAYSASALGAATGLALGLTLGATLAWWELHRATHEVADR